MKVYYKTQPQGLTWTQLLITTYAIIGLKLMKSSWNPWWNQQKPKISKLVVCQWPRNPCGTQVCYLQEPLTRHFQPLISLQPLGQCLSNSHILCSPYTYVTLHTKFEWNRPSSLQDVCSWKLPHFLHLFSSSHCFTKVTLSQPKTPFPWIDFFKIWHTYKALCGLS